MTVEAALLDIRLHLPNGGARLTGVLVIVSFLLSFLFIRTSARLMRSPKVPWWPGSVTSGDLHVHHLVFGIVLMMLCGFLDFALHPGEPWIEIFAVGFGIGAGLTLDEFALWLHLEDVYWAEEGRRSIDAVVVAALLGGAIVLGASPLTKEDAASALTIVASLAIVIAISAIAALKGKYISAVVGVPVPLISLVAAIRLAEPDSPWARRRYPPGSRKLARATARGERHRARYRRWQDLIAGAPSAADPPPDRDPARLELDEVGVETAFGHREQPGGHDAGEAARRPR